MAQAQFSRRQVVAGFLTVPVVMSVAPGRALAASHVGKSVPVPREHVDLNQGWRFHLGTRPHAGTHLPSDGAEWSTVELPHTWNARDGQDGGTARGDDGDYVRGEGWYRRQVRVPAQLGGKRLFLQFDGANTTTDVWIDGTHLGRHVGGYGRFRFDATAALDPGGSNEIVVRVSNAEDPNVAPLSADFTFFGGLYRGVNLQATEPVHVDLLDFAGPGVYLRQREVSWQRASIEVVTKVANDTTHNREVRVRTVIADADDMVVQDVLSEPSSMNAGARVSVNQMVRIESPRLWNGRADPHCYRVAVEVRDARTGDVLDVVHQPLGLRSFTVRPGSGASLNGAPLPLRGVSRHQDRADKGFAISDADHEQDFALMHEMGVNALRTAHYEQAQKVYDLADSLGIVVYTEVPWVNAMTDSAAFRANVKHQLLELIRQTYNHASVLIWGVGNELGSRQWDKDPQMNALLAELVEIVRSEDSSRQSGYAHVLTRPADDPLTSHAELSGYNRYEGWYEGTAAMVGPWADALHARNPERAIGLTEYGAGGNIHQHEEPSLSTPSDPSGPWHPEEYQSVFHESYLKQINARPYLWGTFAWNMFDFASDGRSEGGHPGINDKGLITHDREVKKDAFFWYKANWSSSPVLHITSRRWTDRTEPVTTVHVYSNAESVLLTVNGENLGTKTSDDHLFKWPIRLRPGRNVVTAEAVVHGESRSDTVIWTLQQGTGR